MHWWLILAALGLLFPGQAAALTLSLYAYPSSVGVDEEITVSLALACAGCGDSYLRAVFFPSGTNYFGLTYNNSGAWISTSADKTLYFKVAAEEMAEGSWSGQLRAKVDAADSAYSGPGSYFFKVMRYTAGGSKSGETEPVTILITGPSPTPTPQPTLIPTIAPASPPRAQATASIRPLPTSIPIILPPQPTNEDIKYSQTPAPLPLFTPGFTDDGSSSPAVLGKQSPPASSPSLWGWVLAGLGLMAVGASVVLLLPGILKSHAAKI